ncbi:unnamed protein product [Bursaphelenchus xylophilus]|uniref:(pine wood nematode) hypothetical protein n=1 Tax=Bursaphelenchus xylophilus TaxID=6326 RepID=A0A1I7RVB6_BURXY|nr:unnamed protein product [Bursaphelenchus xylophilus]CAG9086644.1 unnamed protein product [Bursaphelenchus xylophilus]
MKKMLKLSRQLPIEFESDEEDVGQNQTMDSHVYPTENMVQFDKFPTFKTSIPEMHSTTSNGSAVNAEPSSMPELPEPQISERHMRKFVKHMVDSIPKEYHDGKVRYRVNGLTRQKVKEDRVPLGLNPFDLKPALKALKEDFPEEIPSALEDGPSPVPSPSHEKEDDPFAEKRAIIRREFDRYLYFNVNTTRCHTYTHFNYNRRFILDKSRSVPEVITYKYTTVSDSQLQKAWLQVDMTKMFLVVLCGDWPEIYGAEKICTYMRFMTEPVDEVLQIISDLKVHKVFKRIIIAPNWTWCNFDTFDKDEAGHCVRLLAKKLCSVRSQFGQHASHCYLFTYPFAFKHQSCRALRNCKAFNDVIKGSFENLCNVDHHAWTFPHFFTTLTQVADPLARLMARTLLEEFEKTELKERQRFLEWISENAYLRDFEA